MKMFKYFVVLAVAFALCLGLCSCGISKEKAVGTWSGEYVYNGSTYAVAFVLSADGDYTKVMYKNGSMHKTEIGTYEVKGGKVILHENGNTGSSTVYKYKGGCLVNNDHKFSKVS